MTRDGSPLPEVIREPIETTPIDDRAGARRLLIALVALVGLVAICVAAWSATQGGIGWDTRSDAIASLEIRSVDRSLTLYQTYRAIQGVNEFYGVLPQQLGDVLHLAATAEWRQLDPDDPSTYAYQGAANVVVAVVAVTALALVVWVTFGSALGAIFGWALTLSTPLWLGMSYVDLKDVPVAAGLTLVSASLVAALALPSRRRSWLIAVALAGLGGSLSLATRPGSLVLLLVLTVGTLLVAGTARLVGRRTGKPVELPLVRPVVTAISAIAIAIGVTWLTNPVARVDTLAWLQDATRVASAFPLEIAVRTAGRDLVSTHLPWWYAPAWLGVQLPLLTLALLVASLVFVTHRVVRRWQRLDVRTVVLLSPLVVQGVVLPVLIVARDTVLYDGIRHLLFTLPALLSLCGIAVGAMDRSLGTRGRRSLAAPLVALAVVAASLTASIRWAPYSYAYVNPLAREGSGRLGWELDYWGISAREGVERLERHGLSSVSVEPSSGVGVPWGAMEEKESPPAGSVTGLYVFRRGDATARRPGCTILFTIERGGRRLGEGARCSPGSG